MPLQSWRASLHRSPKPPGCLKSLNIPSGLNHSSLASLPGWNKFPLPFANCGVSQLLPGPQPEVPESHPSSAASDRAEGGPGMCLQPGSGPRNVFVLRHKRCAQIGIQNQVLRESMGLSSRGSPAISEKRQPADYRGDLCRQQGDKPADCR